MVKRTYILGAGFSKAFADGPLMNELGIRLENEFDSALANGGLLKGFAHDLKRFFSNLEEIVKNRFSSLNNLDFKSFIGENVEYIFTLMDLEAIQPTKDINTDELSIMDLKLDILHLIRDASNMSVEGLTTRLTTFLYKILVDLNPSSEISIFCSHISPNDSLINFNYDLVLEKSLWALGLWSPLRGYVGVDDFEKNEDGISLMQNNKESRIKTHKMHGSLDWFKWSADDKIKIRIDDFFHGTFFYANIADCLNNRNPMFKPGKFNGRYSPPWIYPSYFKPFKYPQILNIWKSAINSVQCSDEIIVFGYSFRAEDPNSLLLLRMAPDNCKIFLIDTNCSCIKENLKNVGIKITSGYSSYTEYLNEHE